MSTLHTLSRFFHDDFSKITSEDVLWEAFADVMYRRFGITHMLYCFTHTRYAASRAGLTPSLYFRHNLPVDYMKRFPDGLNLDDDIVIGLLLQGKSRILWTEVDEFKLSRGERERHELDKKLGFGAGISYSLRFAGTNGVVGLCMSARHANPESFNAMCRRHVTGMEKLVADFDASMRPLMVANRLKLTPRERDVLAYSAGGMTAKQIAEHLKLSPKTVANTLERARHALGAVSTMEAVAKAMIYDLLG
jgi:LuxR family transcriptional regulator, quorum-sensing system regulator SdiA